MKRKTYLIIVFLTISLTAMPIQGLQSLSQNISSYGVVSYTSGMGWLRTDGKWIVDSEGNIVNLRGANFMGYEFGAWETHAEEDYARMASWGFNVVRLPIAWHYIEPQPRVYESSYFEKYVDRDVAWAKKYGIYIILDMHQWYWSPHFTFFSNGSWRGNGVPVWMVSGYPDSADGLGQAITDFWLGKAPNGTEAGETNPSMQDRFIDVWKYVVNRYRNEASILAYDLFNEPYRSDSYYTNGLTVWQTASYLYPFYNRLVSAIQEIDSKHIIIYEPVGGWHTPSTQKLTEPNLIFSFHCYDYNSQYDGNATALEENFYNKFLAKPLSHPIINWGIPLFIGEFGTYLEYLNADLWIKDMLIIFGRYQLHWAYWTFYKADKGSALLYSNGTEKISLTEPLKEAIRQSSTI